MIYFIIKKEEILKNIQTRVQIVEVPKKLK
jgi:hypothetical protein